MIIKIIVIVNQTLKTIVTIYTLTYKNIETICTMLHIKILKLVQSCTAAAVGLGLLLVLLGSFVSLLILVLFHLPLLSLIISHFSLFSASLRVWLNKWLVCAIFKLVVPLVILLLV